jgi:hypothetical protein
MGMMQERGLGKKRKTRDIITYFLPPAVPLINYLLFALNFQVAVLIVRALWKSKE